MVAKLGNFLVDIDTKVNDKGVKSLNNSLTGLITKSAKFGVALTGAIVGTGAGFTKLIQNTVNETAELGRLADDLGITTNFLETFIRSFETVGASGEEAIGTIRSLKREVEAFKLGQGNVEAFGILGLNIQNFGNDFSKNFDLIRRRFNNLSKEQRLYFVDQIGLGEKTLRVLRLTDKEYSNLQKTSRKFPLATKNQIDSAQSFFENMKRINQSFTSFKRSLILDVTPAFTKFTDQLIKLLSDPTFQKDIANIFSKFFDETLPKLVKAAPIIADAIGQIASSISTLADGLNQLSNNPFIKGTSNVIGKAGSSYINFFKKFGELTAGAISSLEDRKALPLRDPNDLTKFRLTPTKEEIEANVRRIQGINQTTNKNILGGNNTYNINIPVTKLGQDVTEEDRLAQKIADEIDRRNEQNADNFKSGVIQ
jgi:X-X-X-Leu-X-X-Gly heptad repeat protein